MNTHTFLRIICITASILSIYSCTVKNTPQYATYMTAVGDMTPPASGNIKYLVSDDSIMIYPANALYAINSLKHNQRIFATFTIPSGEITDPVQVEFSTVSYLDEEDIMETTAPDSLGNDPMPVISAWHSGGIHGAGRFVTLTFEYRGGGMAFHSMALADNTDLENNPDEDGYYHLFLRHNSNNDPELYYYSGVTTYPLTDKYTAAGIKGLKINFKTFSSDYDSTVVVNY